MTMNRPAPTRQQRQDRKKAASEEADELELGLKSAVRKSVDSIRDKVRATLDDRYKSLTDPHA